MGTVIYGICGIQRGVGCTHLALSSSYYLSGTLGYKTALMEVGERVSLLSLYNSDMTASRISGQSFFRYDFFDVFYNASSPDICCLPYERIVLDLQEPPNGSVLELLDFLFILCDNKPWNESSLRTLHKLKNLMTQEDRSILGVQNEREEGFRENILKAHGLKAIKLPRIRDPKSPGKDFKPLHKYFS